MKARGQTLVLFVLLLFVLLGTSALAIDYANWLLTDRQLQNASDHAALAGASVFNQDINQATCGANPGQQLCIDARAQAWTSLSDELKLNIPPATITCLATPTASSGGNTPQAGWASTADGGCPAAATFAGQRIWVSTPPPFDRSYSDVGGRLAGNFGVVFVRVDRPTRAFLSGAIGINPSNRTGWATAGALPNDFALQVFCRDGTNPAGSNSSCVSKGIGIEGGGGIALLRGDIGSNQSLQVTQNGGPGVVVRNGNVFLTTGSCGSQTWNCPPAVAGGISDGNGNAKNAFLIPPQPVPHFTSPLDYASLTTCPTQAQWEDVNTGHVPCVPRRIDAQYGVSSPNYDWSCSASNASNHCGDPVLGFDANGNRTVKCTAWFDPNGAPVGERHLLGYSDIGSSAFRGSQYGPQDIYRNLKDTSQDPAGTLNSDLTPTVLTNAPSNWVYSNDGDDGAAYRVSIQSPNGIPDAGNMTVRYVLFKTINNGTRDTVAGGNAVTVTVQLQENVGGNWTNRGPADVHVASEATTAYQYQVSSSAITSFNALALRISVQTTRSTGQSASNNRGAGISWAEVETTNLQPALPPLIPPGYYHSITIPDSGCALLDPTGWRNGLLPYQLAGVYRFGGGNNDATISLGQNAVLIGDGVTLTFDSDFPDVSGGRGITLGNNAALVINTFVVGGFDTSQTLPQLPTDALGAAWGIDPTTTAGIYPGGSAYGESALGAASERRRGVCTPEAGTTSALSFCIERASYTPVASPITYRGISFYFTNSWPATSIKDRFQMSGSTGNEPGIAFKGVLYAPYDDVKLTGGNGFNTIGQVLSWTAKFAGQATIYLDYPYARCQQTNSCLPYLLEPTVNQ